MKKIVFILLVLSLLFSGCEVNRSIGVSQEVITKTDVVKLQVKEATDEKLAIEIINKSKNEVGYDEAYFLEFNKNGEWHRLKPKYDESFNTVEYVLEKEKSCTWGDNISRIYGKLPEGKYRLIKYFTIFEKNTYSGEDIILSAQFIIN